MIIKVYVFNYMQVNNTCNNRASVRTLLYYIIYRCKDFLLFAFIDIFMCFVFIFSLFVYFICEKREKALPLHQKSINYLLINQKNKHYEDNRKKHDSSITRKSEQESECKHRSL